MLTTYLLVLTFRAGRRHLDNERAHLVRVRVRIRVRVRGQGTGRGKGRGVGWG